MELLRLLATALLTTTLLLTATLRLAALRLLTAALLLTTTLRLAATLLLTALGLLLLTTALLREGWCCSHQRDGEDCDEQFTHFFHFMRSVKQVKKSQELQLHQQLKIELPRKSRRPYKRHRCATTIRR
jgi:hypothetical protein